MGNRNYEYLGCCGPAGVIVLDDGFRNSVHLSVHGGPECDLWNLDDRADVGPVGVGARRARPRTRG